MLTSLQYSISVRDFDVDNIDIRRSIEDSLIDFRFSYWATPPEAPKDVVRMAGQTEHGHSLLQLSSSLAYLIINFDSSYNKDMGKCISYARNKLMNLTDALGTLKLNVAYNGVIAQYVYEEIDNPISRLSQKLIHLNTGESPLQGLTTRFTIIHRDMYYINVELAALTLSAQEKRALGVRLDINDRYGIEKKGLTGNVNDIFKLTTIQEQIDQAKIIRLLDEGRFELNG